MKIDSNKNYSVVDLELNSTGLKNADPVVTLGYPLDLQPILYVGSDHLQPTQQQGYVTLIGDKIQHSAIIQHGSSGSPLFSKVGKVVGVNASGLNKSDEGSAGVTVGAEGFYYAIRIEHVHELLKD